MAEIADATLVKLQSNDDRIFEVTYKIAKQSGTLKNMLDGVCFALALYPRPSFLLSQMCWV